MPSTKHSAKPTIETAVYPLYADLGEIFRIQPEAARYLEMVKLREEDAIERAQRFAPRTVLILQAHGRSQYSLYYPGYLIHDVAGKAGLNNLVEIRTFLAEPERVLRYDPDYIIYVSLPTVERMDKTDAEVFAEVRENRNLAGLRAVCEGHIINIPYAEVNSGNDRVVDALERIVKARELYNY